MLLTAVGRLGQRGERLKAFFATPYYAALRPSEAVMLRKAGLHLPKAGWGRIVLSASASRAGRAWTDEGTARQERGLKHRADNETRCMEAIQQRSPQGASGPRAAPRQVHLPDDEELSKADDPSAVLLDLIQSRDYGQDRRIQHVLDSAYTTDDLAWRHFQDARPDPAGGSGAALGAGAVCAAFVLVYLPKEEGQSAFGFAVELAYPIAFVALVLVVVGAATVASQRSRRAWVTLTAGFAMLVVPSARSARGQNSWRNSR